VIPDGKIDEIRERIDLVALMGRHGVELKKSGRSFKGCCPFHQEKTPSFHVWPEEKRFKCFGCQAGGDAFTFVQRLFGKSFLDSVRDLAKDAGVELSAAGKVG
jgi:DNA primase